MTNKYIFYPGTIEGEALKNLRGEEQAAILQNTKVWDESHVINEEVSRILENKTPITGEINTKNQVEISKNEGMDKLTITLTNGERKEIHIQRNFLKLSDDSILKYTLSNGALSNFPEDEIKDYSLLITKNKYGDYHFGHTAALKECKKLGMRLLTDEEMDSPEFNKYIAQNTTEFPGVRYSNSNNDSDSVFGSRGDYVSFWGASSFGNEASVMGFTRESYRANRGKSFKSSGLLVLLVKD